jgi:hypothetical protein
MMNSSAIFAVAFITLISFGSSCDTKDRDNMTEPSPTPSAPPETHPSPSAPEWLAAGATHRVADITGAPKASIGKTVTVVAEVDEVYGPRAFTLEGNEDHAKVARKDLLTLVPKVGGFPKVDAQWKDSEARVTGVVQRMIVKDVEREIGWELPAKLKSRFKGGPVLIARSVERLAE